MATTSTSPTPEQPSSSDHKPFSAQCSNCNYSVFVPAASREETKCLVKEAMAHKCRDYRKKRG